VTTMIRMHCEGQPSRTAAEHGKNGHYISSLHLSCGGPLQDPVARDLLRVGQAAFLTDRAFRRGEKLGQRTRILRVIVPVEQPRRWQALRGTLSALANFVTHDQWDFRFVPTKTIPPRARFRRSPVETNCIQLFSGGLDSLCGAAAAFRRKEVPFLVTHSPPGKTTVQMRISALQKRLGCTAVKPEFANFFFRASDRNKRGRRSLFPERSRRTRPILFLSMAGAIALEFRIPKIYISENGVLAVNLPFRPYLHGALITRHAHPETLRRFAALLKAVWSFGQTPQVENPFLASTKGEELRHLGRAADLAVETVSCEFAGQQTANLMHWLSKHRRRWRGIRECGLCSACLVRRAAMHKARIREPQGHYAFAPRTALHRPRTYAPRPLFHSVRFTVSHILDFCDKLRQMSPAEFARLYATEIACVGGFDASPGETAQELYRLYRRFASEVFAFMSNM
jgi:7-cyano-7-deazaguanine synthase in queuosine biosynthesis